MAHQTVLTTTGELFRPVRLHDAGRIIERAVKWIDDPLFNSDESALHEESEHLRRLFRLMDGDEHAVSWITETLQLTLNDRDYSARREHIAAVLARELSLESAVPHRVVLLHNDDGKLNSVAIHSLTNIGGDCVIDPLDHRFRASSQKFQTCAASVLQGIHSDYSERRLLAWLDVMPPTDAHRRVLQALLAGCVPAGLERARDKLLAETPFDTELGPLRITFIFLCSMAHADFPQLEQWRETAAEDFEDEWHPKPTNMDPDYDDWVSARPDDDSLWGSWTVHDPMNDIFDDANSSWSAAEPADTFADSPAPIVNTQPKVGRNDPCPVAVAPSTRSAVCAKRTCDCVPLFDDQTITQPPGREKHSCSSKSIRPTLFRDGSCRGRRLKSTGPARA